MCAETEGGCGQAEENWKRRGAVDFKMKGLIVAVKGLKDNSGGETNAATPDRSIDMPWRLPACRLKSVRVYPACSNIKQIVVTNRSKPVHSASTDTWNSRSSKRKLLASVQCHGLDVMLDPFFPALHHKVRYLSLGSLVRGQESLG